jgi:integrase
MSRDKGKDKGNGDKYKGTNIKQIVLADGTVRYRLKFFIGLNPETGKREFFNATYDTETEAKDKAAALRVSRAGGAPVRPSKETLTAFLKRWLSDVKEGELRARTLYDYENLLRRYIFSPPKGTPAIGRTRLNRLHPQQFQNLYAHMRRDMGLSPRTIQYLHTVLRGALSHAVLMGDLARNPTDGLKAPRQKLEDGEGKTQEGETRRKIRAMDKEQAKAFQEAAKQDRYYPLWVLLLHTGLRPGEALGLKWTDVDLDQDRLQVRRALTRLGVEGWRLVEPKTPRARRTVTLPPFAVRALREWKAKQAEERLGLGSEYKDHGFVFTTPFGAPLDGPNLYSRNYRRILEAAKLGTWEEKGEGARVFRPGFRMYDLRHTHATLLLLAGENVKVVSERLGHASVVLTMDTYSHVLPTMQEAAADKMEALLGRG